MIPLSLVQLIWWIFLNVGINNLVILATLFSRNRNVHTYRSFSSHNVQQINWFFWKIWFFLSYPLVKEFKHCQMQGTFLKFDLYHVAYMLFLNQNITNKFSDIVLMLCFGKTGLSILQHRLKRNWVVTDNIRRNIILGLSWAERRVFVWAELPGIGVVI